MTLTEGHFLFFILFMDYYLPFLGISNGKRHLAMAPIPLILILILFCPHPGLSQ